MQTTSPLIQQVRTRPPPRNTISISEIENFERYTSIDWSHAEIVATSLTHGVVIAPDADQFDHVRIALLGSRNGYSVPKLKAHNSFSHVQAIRIAQSLYRLASHGTDK